MIIESRPLKSIIFIFIRTKIFLIIARRMKFIGSLQLHTLLSKSHHRVYLEVKAFLINSGLKLSLWKPISLIVFQ